MSGAKGACCPLARTQNFLPLAVPLAHAEAWAEAFARGLLWDFF